MECEEAEPEGLWSIVVFVGLALERSGVIKSFETRTEENIQEIIAFLGSTKLALRLEDAYPPFDFREKKTDYDWTELERIRIDLLTAEPDDSLIAVKSAVCKFLKSHYTDLNAPCIDRIQFHVFQKYYADGTLELVVDKGLSIAVARTGVLSTGATWIFPALFMVALLAVIPLWVIVGFWYGAASLLVALVSNRIATTQRVTGVRALASSDKKMFRLFLARHIIWMRKPQRRGV